VRYRYLYKYCNSEYEHMGTLWFSLVENTRIILVVLVRVQVPCKHEFGVVTS
jgi:hypothetical protein